MLILIVMIVRGGAAALGETKVVTKVEVAWNEAWVGGEQSRFICFEGDVLHIGSPPIPHPNVEKRVVRVILTWARSK